MNRLMSAVCVALTAVLLVAPVCADDPPKKLTPEERKELEAKLTELNAAGFKAYQEGKYPGAVKSFEAVVELARRAYPKTEFPDGHALLATGLNNLASLYKAQGKFAEAEPLFRESFDMRKRLFKGDHPEVLGSLFNLAGLCEARGKLAEAEAFSKDALETARRLHKGDHPQVAVAAFGLGILYESLRRYGDAEPLFKEALEMRKRLFKGDHPQVVISLYYLGRVLEAQEKLASAEVAYREVLERFQRLHKGDHPQVAHSLNNLGKLLLAVGKETEAERLYTDALVMHRRLHKGDHPDVAISLNNLGLLFDGQEKLDEAERFHRDALAMKKRLFDGDHPSVAISLNNLAMVLEHRGKLADAENFYRDALTMLTRLYKGDHPDVTTATNNLAMVLHLRGKFADAERIYRDTLAMKQRVYKGDHLYVVAGLNNLGTLLMADGRHADAGRLFRDALAMSRRLTTAFARQKTEGEALTLVAARPLYRDVFLSNERAFKSDPADVYPVVWADKGFVARVYEQRHLQARAGAAGGQVAKSVADLAGARRARAELLLAPATRDPGTLKKREDDLKVLDDTVRRLNEVLADQLPAVARADRLNDAAPTDLQKVLPAETAVVDFLRYRLFEYDRDKTGKDFERQTPSYAAFVVTRDKVAWVELDTAEKIESAVAAWRGAITGGKEIPASVPAKVRELVWEKVRKHLPAGTKTVYLCPDATLYRVPWGAVPGDKPGTILLEDFAVGTIPHAPFLLDKLRPQDPRKNPPPVGPAGPVGRPDNPAGALVVGAVKYDAEPAANPKAGELGAPLVKPGAKAGWLFLPNTTGEANGAVAAAERKKLTATRLDGDKATTSAVLSALPRAKYAHFATHGFFADPSFRSVFQLDPKDYEKGWRGERVGRAANSPLVMTGLVFAGANNPKTPGRGIVTGEQLIDLDLSGLELAVLSACETGLGDVAGGEGVFGLQRAFHYAGTTNVVASLWKVPDQSTAALMGLFYANLWDKNLAPIEALRQAQIELYKNPQKIPALAKGFRDKFEEVPGMGGEIEVKPTKDGKAHPLLWAAFTLSGPGR